MPRNVSLASTDATENDDATPRAKPRQPKPSKRLVELKNRSRAKRRKAKRLTPPSNALATLANMLMDHERRIRALEKVLKISPAGR